jgi:Holliday junction resolvasome RuvABC endonuclease subunit
MALDVGFRNTGVAIMQHRGGKWLPIHVECIRTKKSDKKSGIRVADDNIRCTQDIYRRLMELAKDNDIAGVVAETPSAGGKSSRAVLAMGLASATVACVVESLGLPAEWVTPRESKIALAGSATASKEEMKESAARTWPTTTKNYKRHKTSGRLPGTYEHIADALATFEAAKNGQVVRLLAQLSKGK